MKAAIISLGSKSSEMQAEAMRKYFDEVDMIALKEIEVSLGKDGKVLYKGESIKDYDCVLVKGSFRYANLLSSISTLLEKKVPYLPMKASAFTIVHNKLLTHLVLQQHNIPMPKTYISSTEDAGKSLLKKVHYPIVMKFPEGTQGRGVMFADSENSAVSLLDALGALKQPFIIQEFIDTGGTDVRALVVGDKVVASMKRKAQDGENRANTHAGGTPESYLLSREASKIAVQTAKALGADICGIDILESPLGPLVIEANVSPGMQGIQAVSSIDVCDQIARFLYQQTDAVINSSKQKAAKDVMKEISGENGTQEIITELQFRGERILLPLLVTKIAKFKEDKEYSLKVTKGRIELQEF
jgi:ribosomal protein S6--L-glutamate ligase